MKGKLLVNSLLYGVKTKTIVALCIGAAIFMGACDKQSPNSEILGENLEQKSLSLNAVSLRDINVKVKNGALHFTDTASFFKDLEAISKMSEEEFVAFEKYLGFKSLSTSLNEAYEAFDILRSESDLKKWKTQFGDIVELRDSVVTPLVPLSTYQRITNRAGEYYQGDAYAKVTEDKIITVANGDKSELKEALSNKKATTGDGVFVDKIVHRRQEITSNSPNISLTSAAPCGGGFLGARREYDKRKVFLDFYVIIYRGISEYAGVVEVEAAAHKKTWLGWNKYKTRFRIENLNFSIVNGKGQTITVYDASGNNTSDTYTYTLTTSLNDVNNINNYVGPSDFQYAGARAASRGTNPYWAVICCNTGCAPDYGNYPF